MKKILVTMMAFALTIAAQAQQYDGINAHIIAMDYLRQESKVSSTTTLPIHMARNGGWCASIELDK